MKVLTKCVVFEGQEFALIKSEHEGKPFWGTIPYTELDSRGCMKRTLNGAEMRISFENAAEALENRRRDVVMSRLLDGFKAQGMDDIEAFMALAKCAEYKALYNF